MSSASVAAAVVGSSGGICLAKKATGPRISKSSFSAWRPWAWSGILRGELRKDTPPAATAGISVWPGKRGYRIREWRWYGEQAGSAFQQAAAAICRQYGRVAIQRSEESHFIRRFGLTRCGLRTQRTRKIRRRQRPANPGFSLRPLAYRCVCVRKSAEVGFRVLAVVAMIAAVNVLQQRYPARAGYSAGRPVAATLTVDPAGSEHFLPLVPKAVGIGDHARCARPGTGDGSTSRARR